MMESAASHPSRKNKNPARVGHPYMYLIRVGFVVSQVSSAAADETWGTHIL